MSPLLLDLSRNKNSGKLNRTQRFMRNSAFSEHYHDRFMRDSKMVSTARKNITHNKTLKGLKNEMMQLKRIKIRRQVGLELTNCSNKYDGNS